MKKAIYILIILFAFQIGYSQSFNDLLKKGNNLLTKSGLKTKTAEEYFEEGKAFKEKNDYENAISSLEKSLELKKSNSEAEYLLGLSYCSLGTKDYEKKNVINNKFLEIGFSHYEKAIALDPKNEKFILHRGLGKGMFAALIVLQCERFNNEGNPRYADYTEKEILQMVDEFNRDMETCEKIHSKKNHKCTLPNSYETSKKASQGFVKIAIAGANNYGKIDTKENREILTNTIEKAALESYNKKQNKSQSTYSEIIKNYACDNCSQIKKSKSSPSSSGCPAKDSGHLWIYIGEAGDVSYSCSYCGTTVYSKSKPERSLYCSRRSGGHIWIKD